MAFDLSSLSDDAFDAEYHRRLANKTPGEAGQKIAQTALVTMGGSEVPAYPPRSTSTDVSQTVPKTPTAQFIGQRGEVFTAPNQDISQSYIDKRGNVRPTVIDARAPVAYGGALSAPSLSSDADWRAKFQPSSDLQKLINRDQATTNAASRVQQPIGTQPTAAFGSGLATPDTTSAYIAANTTAGVTNLPSGGTATVSAPKLASNDDYNAPQNDPFRKFFGGGIQTPTPTPTPSPPPKIADDTPYWRKKQEDDNAYA